MNQPSTQPTEQKSAVFLLSGFLGAGKTTLLKRILAWESDLSDTVILVNEFGDIGIDGDLFKNSGSDVVELVSGCICCTLSAELKQSLLYIWEKYRPRRIFIEASGVADPTAILTALMDYPLTETMMLEKIVTVLDADLWEGREYFGRLFYNQLETAHLILLNKIDQVDETKIPSYLKEIHEVIPDCQVVPTIRCGIDPATLWTPTTQQGVLLKPMHLFRQVSLDDHEEHRETDHNEYHDHSKSVRADNFVTFFFEDHRIMDKARFLQFIEALPWELFRMKGPVHFADRTELVNFVGGKGEWSEWDGEPETQLAFIGWNVNPEEILERLGFCML
ncbi:MAG: GTP-binding protein [Desulfobacterales bacterium]|jgi:G3E family GTPase